MNTKNLLRLALAAALLLVAAAPRAARADCSDGVLDGDELGIDCGGSCAPCTCGTDLTRLADPPRLINSNTDLTGDAVETGLAGDDLRVAFTLDAKVFTTATTEGGNTFAAPEIEFVDKAGGTNEAVLRAAFGSVRTVVAASAETVISPKAESLRSRTVASYSSQPTTRTPSGPTQRISQATSSGIGVRPNISSRRSPDTRLSPQPLPSPPARTTTHHIR